MKQTLRKAQRIVGACKRKAAQWSRSTVQIVRVVRAVTSRIAKTCKAIARILKKTLRRVNRLVVIARVTVQFAWQTIRTSRIYKILRRFAARLPGGTRAIDWVRTHRFEALLVAALIIGSTFAHAWNMYGYPYYENDEATYTSRAQAFATEGQLDVYTYRYDHAPVGWMFLGFWQILTGGEHITGSLLQNGRIFMLVLHIASTVLVYVLAKRFSRGSKLAGAVAVAFFALSPIAIYFQRRILLDNIMTFWLLLSVYLATQPVPRLKSYIGSALAFGMAVLTKLNAIFMLPAMAFLVWTQSHRKHRLHAASYWLSVAGIVIAGFFLFALLKGELFSSPLDANGDPAHVSVVDTFKLQLGRGDFAYPWDPTSSFRTNVDSWLLKDWAVLTIGAFSTVALALISLWRVIRRRAQPMMIALVLLIAMYIAFLARGKIVLDLYIVPLIPLLALSIGVFAATIYNDWLRRWRLIQVIFLGALIGGLIGLFISLPGRHYHVDETSNQLAAVEWVREHVPEDAIIAADNYIYPYLAQEGDYRNVSYFFAAEYDPEVRKLYGDDWRNVEYLVLTHEVVDQIKTGTVPRMKQIFDHAELLADYREDISSFVDLKNYISTNGDWVQVYRIKSRTGIVQQDSWQYFKNTFIVDYGQVVDLTNGALTSSGVQAQTMLRAVDEDDEAMFQGLWQWSKDHLRYRADDKLLSWKWELQPDGTYTLTDSNNVCDADQTIAYALFKADERWPGNGYGKEAKEHLQDWWRKCTFEREGKRYVDSSADGSQDIKLINPGYFQPAMYAYFAKKSPELSWQQLTNNGYELLDQLYEQHKTIPDWAVIGLDGSLQSAVPLVGDNADRFGYDAMQLVPSLVNAYSSSGDARALKVLGKLRAPVKQFASDTKSPSAQAAHLMLRQALLREDGQKEAAAIQLAYERHIHEAYDTEEGYWGEGSHYRDQVWLWQWYAIQEQLSSYKRVDLR